MSSTSGCSMISDCLIPSGSYIRGWAILINSYIRNKQKRFRNIDQLFCNFEKFVLSHALQIFLWKRTKNHDFAFAKKEWSRESKNYREIQRHKPIFFGISNQEVKGRYGYFRQSGLLSRPGSVERLNEPVFLSHWGRRCSGSRDHAGASWQIIFYSTTNKF